MQAVEVSGRTRVVAGIVAVAILTGVAIASVLTLLPPSPRSADAPADQFSADRAYQSVRTIGQDVHVAGSPAADRVRSFIVSRLTELGLHPQLREGIGQTDALGGPAMAHVTNVAAVIPGTDPSGQLIMMAHYDSVQVSYGANDDGSGVASLLETARALTSAAPLRNDVLLLFTDAEEACLCGAESFVHSDPLGADGGVVLNFESRGSSGPSIMFETATGNADLVAHYAQAVPYPVATSMAVEVYRILPNDTDFTPFLDSGRFTGLNSAYIDGSAVYHSPEDRPAYMDTGTLQAHGANALALARNLGNADLAELGRPASYDATYFPVLGGLVQYPGYLVWPLAVLALLAAAGLLLVVHRRRGLSWTRLAAGGALMLVPLIGAAVIAQLYWMLLVAIRPGYGPMLDPWRPGWYRAAVCALVLVVTVGWYAWWRRRFGRWGLAAGGLAWLAILGVAMAALVPGGSYLAALPALFGALAGIAALLVPRWWAGLLAPTLAGVVAVLVLAPTVLLFFPALGLATGAAAALVATLLAIAVLPVLDHLHPLPVGERGGVDDPHAARLTEAYSSAIGAPAEDDPHPPWYHRAGVTLVAVVLAAAFTGIGLVADRFDAAHPRPTQLMYALDADTGDAHWVSEQTDPGGWTGQYITGTTDLSAAFPLLRGELASGPAESAELPAPTVSVDDDRTEGDERTLTVTIQSHRQARLLDVSLPGRDVRKATVAAGSVSRDIDVGTGDFDLLFHAPPDGTIRLTFTVDHAGPVTLRVLDGTDGLSGLPGFVPRPADVGVQGSHTSELVLVGTTVTV